MLKLVQHAPAAPHIALLTKARVVESLRALDRSAWDACYPGELEAYDYLMAVEEAGIAGFSWRYIVVEEAGRILAAMPAFFTDYGLDTTLPEGMLRRAIRRMRQNAPRFLILRLACLGSPETECGRVGFHPSVAQERMPELLAQLLAAFEHVAQHYGSRLLGIKDTPEDQHALWHAVAQHYTPLPAMAVATLPIDFDSIDGYLARLSKASRKDMRRKLKASDALRIEQRAQIDDVLPHIMTLYTQTKERSEFHLDDLTPAYFQGLLRHMQGRAFCTLYWLEEELIAANFLLRNDQLLLDKFFCMADHGREHDLYFISWFENLRYCLAHGQQHYQSGQACLDNKKRLKSDLKPNHMWFRHRHRLINRILKAIAPLLAMEEDV